MTVVSDQELEQQIRAVRIERSAAAVLIDQAGDLRRALLRDHLRTRAGIRPVSLRLRVYG